MQGGKSLLRSDSRVVDDESIDEADNIIISYPLISEDEKVPVFPTFEDDKELLIFKRIKLVHCDVYAIFPVLFLYIAGYSTRGDLPDVLTFGPWFTAVMVFGAVTFCLYFFIFATMVVRQIFRGNTQSIYFLLSKRILNTRIKHYFDESLPVLVSMTTGLLLYARGKAGQCPTSDIWGSQGCNPVADCNGIAQDQVVVCLLSPVVFQLLMKGVRFRTIILSWVISTLFVIISIIDVQAWAAIWDIYYSLFVLFILIESERLMRLSFLQNKVVLYHEANRNELVSTARLHARAMRKARYELKIVSVQAEKDKHEIEVERARLRSLIGNVAHDLKNPLQSIGMSIELLRDDLHASLRKDTMPPEIQNAVNLLTLESADNTLDILTSMSSFMAMAINRCLDFTKASSGISLVPSMEPINLSEALAIPVDCINSLQSDAVIVVNPIPADICQFIITDKHWLIGNILCLLSNATKYSTCGEVNVILELDFQTHEFLSHKILRVTVEDSGIGIPDDERKMLFQPFAQAQKMTGGTGLGLYSLSKRQQALGGAYGVHDRRDGKQGSAFWISFPYRPDHMSVSGKGGGSYTTEGSNKALGYAGNSPILTLDIPSRTQSDLKGHGYLQGQGHGSTEAQGHGQLYRQGQANGQEQAIGVGQGQIQALGLPLKLQPPSFNVAASKVAIPALNRVIVPLRILIVEDSLPILKVVCQMLKQKGHTVDSAQNGSLGLDKMIQCYSTKDYDLVLMDLQMPVMDGIETTRRYREYERLQKRRMMLQSEESFINGNTSAAPSAVETRRPSREEQLSMEKISAFRDKSDAPITSKPLQNLQSFPATVEYSGVSSFAVSGQISPMPGETLDAILQRSYHQQMDINALPIIGMSANSDSYSKDCALQVGMNLFLPKPFTISELQDVLGCFQPRISCNNPDSSCYVTGNNTIEGTRNNSIKYADNGILTFS